LVLLPVVLSFDRWQIVRDVINLQPFRKDLCVQVGSDGSLFVHCKGNMTMSDVIDTASSAKMLGGMPLMEKMDSGNVTVDDKVSKYLDYWTTDPSDIRSKMTLRDLLSFQSGYHSSDITSFCGKHLSGDFYLHDCVKYFYENVKIDAEPGTVWAYSSNHLQIIGAVTEVVYGQRIEQILNESLARYNMTSSYWYGGHDPVLAGSLKVSGNDYGQFMDKYFNGKIIPYAWRMQMEAEYNIYPNVGVANFASNIFKQFVGHYGWLNWFECQVMLSFPKYMRRECYDAAIHSDPGLFGYWPTYHQRDQYWMQLVLQGSPVLGCVQAALVQIVVEPFVDWAKKGGLLADKPTVDWNHWAAKYEELKKNEDLSAALLKFTRELGHDV